MVFVTSSQNTIEIVYPTHNVFISLIISCKSVDMHACMVQILFSQYILLNLFLYFQILFQLMNMQYEINRK